MKSPFSQPGYNLWSEAKVKTIHIWRMKMLIHHLGQVVETTEFQRFASYEQ